jgi:hypothetical protein
VSNLTFYCPSRDGRRKAANIPAMTSTVRPSYPGISRARPYPFPVDPLSYIPTLPRPPSVEQRDYDPYVDHRESHVLCSTPDVNITTTPKGWPACTGARRHSNTDSARSAFSSKAPPRVCCKPYPPVESIKWEGKELSRGTNNGGRTNKTDISPTSEINISSNTLLYSFFETWDRFPLSQFVTPTQALRCKEIQYSPFPTGRRAFFCPNQDKPPVYSLCIIIRSREYATQIHSSA